MITDPNKLNWRDHFATMLMFVKIGVCGARVVFVSLFVLLELFCFVEVRINAKMRFSGHLNSRLLRPRTKSTKQMTENIHGSGHNKYTA
jgi:hypothetical protein